MALIGIMGQAGHGKDTIGEILKRKHSFHTYALAQPLKEGVCKGVFGLSDEQLHTQIGKETVDSFWSVSPRQIMQFVGTELFREQMSKLIPNCGNDFWLMVFKKWRRNLFIKLGYIPNIVITDLRFANEVDFVRKYGGKVWKVERCFGIQDDVVEKHKSETEQLQITNFDVLIKNDGTIEDLEKKVDELMKKL